MMLIGRATAVLLFASKFVSCEDETVLPSQPIVEAACEICSCDKELRSFEECRADIARYTAHVERLQKEHDQLSLTSTKCASDLQSSVRTHQDETAKLQQNLLNARNDFAQTSQQRDTLKQQVVDLQNKVQEAQSKLSRTSQEAEAKIAEQAQALSASQTAANEAKRETEQIQKLLQEMRLAVQDNESQLQQLVSTRNHLQTELDSFKSTIYSTAHFWKTFQHTKQVGLAFVKFTRKRCEQVLGVDAIELIKLQTAIWSKKANLKERVHFLQKRVNIMYDKHLKTSVDKVMIHAVVYGARFKMVGQDLFDKILIQLDKVMSNTINNLSSVDPDIRGLFPTDFNDRCCAFAYILLIGYFVSNAIQALFNTLIWTPLHCLIYGRRSTKSRRVPGKASRRRAEAGTQENEAVTKKMVDSSRPDVMRKEVKKMTENKKVHTK